MSDYHAISYKIAKTRIVCKTVKKKNNDYYISRKGIV